VSRSTSLAQSRAPDIRRQPIRSRLLLGAAMLPLVFAACAPDAWTGNPTYDTFLNKVQRVCGNKNIGGATVNDLLNQDSSMYSAFFVDLTSRYDLGKISQQDYVSGVMSVGGGSESEGLKCIVAQKSP
jgi:hypothetical protein